MPTLHLTAKRNQRDFAWPGALLADNPEPSWPQIEAAVTSLPADTAPLYLTGGEPTLRRDLFTIIGRLARVFPQRPLVLVTNGRFFFYERACTGLAAIEAPNLTVEVMIASTRRDVHDEVVGVAESYDQASRGIQQLLARACNTRVRILIGTHNAGHLHDIAACIPDRFAGIERVVWDIATLAASAPGLSLRPDQVSSQLESALNLLRTKQTAATVCGMPLCTISEKYRVHVDRATGGQFRSGCAPCQLRADCPGLVASLVANADFPINPIVPTTGEESAEYDRYLGDLLDRYVPAEARAARTVLDAMCGRRLRNLSALRSFFRGAATVQGTDIDLDDAPVGPPGTSVFRSDLQQPLAASVRYDCIVLFKPPGNAPGQPIGTMLAHLVAALEPGGHLVVVLAEHTDVDTVLDVLRQTGVGILTSERNALRSHIEPEHKWIVVCGRS